MKVKVNKVTIRLFQGDIRTVVAEAVVTVTDPQLNLDPDLVRRAGVEVQRELAAIGWCEVGSAVITSAGKLSTAKKIIHAVAPRWGEGSERGKLANVTLEALRLTEQNTLRSIVIPAISTGALGYPLENCALTLLTQAIDYTFEELRALRSIIFCLVDERAYAIFKTELERQIADLRETNQGQVQV
ncbi:MAG: macro domain-containing protein [Chloroflexota bacterium]|nr:macro domain-containing protein [Chloroflexota bacterium]